MRTRTMSPTATCGTSRIPARRVSVARPPSAPRAPIPEGPGPPAHQPPAHIGGDAGRDNTVIVRAASSLRFPERAVGLKVAHLVEGEGGVDAAVRVARDRIDQGDARAELIEENRARLPGGDPAHLGRPALLRVGLIEDLPDVEVPIPQVELEGVLHAQSMIVALDGGGG